MAVWRMQSVEMGQSVFSLLLLQRIFQIKREHFVKSDARRSLSSESTYAPHLLHPPTCNCRSRKGHQSQTCK